MGFLTGIASFFVPGGPLLGFAGFIFNPKRLIVWGPLLFLAAAIGFAGVRIHDYIKEADANKKAVVQLQSDVKTATNEVELERQSVQATLTAMNEYAAAVQQYAKTQDQTNQEIAALRSTLNPSKIIQKAQTDATGATADTNAEYNSMLGLFDQATGATPITGTPSPVSAGKAKPAAGQPGPHQPSPVASHQKRDTGP